jgi:hydroxyethylthiazole kinase-like uncharacterized protein yjeF
VSALGHPILSCAEAHAFEAKWFAGEEAREWPAMQRAGRALAAAILQDFEEVGGFPVNGRVLVLAGKGHNGGDALLAALGILQRFPQATIDVIFAFGQRTLRPLARRAWILASAHQPLSWRTPRVSTAPALMQTPEGPTAATRYDLLLDGVFGFQFRPPLTPAITALFARVNAMEIGLRAAVDLPSGLGDDTGTGDSVLRADFTYATGIVKTPVVNGLNADVVGRLRYLDLGFFARESIPSRLRVLDRDVLAPLARLRAPESDKRDYGHVLVVGGSRSYPGAVLMTVLAALRSGAGLVTAFVPESLAPTFAARAPEAMWVGWPETPSGGLALEGQHLWRERLERATSAVIGPGLAREAETMALVRELVATSPVPLVLDADALQPEIVRAGTARRVLTPHLGELRRMLDGDDFYSTPAGRDAIVVVKGRMTGIARGGRAGYYSPFGGPVLARGGSGDLLAGMIGTMLAQLPDDPLLAAARGVVWHGGAADSLARAQGQVAVQTTQLLDYLAEALRAGASNGET